MADLGILSKDVIANPIPWEFGRTQVVCKANFWMNPKVDSLQIMAGRAAAAELDQLNDHDFMEVLSKLPDDVMILILKGSTYEFGNLHDKYPEHMQPRPRVRRELLLIEDKLGKFVNRMLR